MGQVKAVPTIDLTTVQGVALMCTCPACAGSGMTPKPTPRAPLGMQPPPIVGRANIECFVCKGSGVRSTLVSFAQFQAWLASQAATPPPAPPPTT